MNESDRLKIWKFEDAPADLSSKFTGAPQPEWLLLVPASMPEVDQAIRRQPDLNSLWRYESEIGVVYAGSSPLTVLLNSVDAASPETIAAARHACGSQET